MASSPMSEFEDSYEAELREGDSRLESAFLEYQIRHLEPHTPQWIAADATVAEAVQRMVECKIGCVLVGGTDALEGIFTERDLLRRVVGEGRDPAATTVRDVMTPKPDSLTADHRVAYALKKMVLRAYRHIPVLDKDGKAVGIVSARDVSRFIASLFPESTLNLPPGDELKNPDMLHGG